MTRRRLYVLGIGLFLLLLTGAVARVWQQPWADPLKVAAGRIKKGMSLAEAEAIIGRKADHCIPRCASMHYSDELQWVSERGTLWLTTYPDLSGEDVITSDPSWHDAAGLNSAPPPRPTSRETE
jgi:hypothetical protein